MPCVGAWLRTPVLQYKCAIYTSGSVRDQLVSIAELLHFMTTYEVRTKSVGILLKCMYLQTTIFELRHI